jgi:hypothetical protein
MRAVVPVHSVKSLSLSVVDPMVDCGLADVEFLSDPMLRLTASDGGDDGSTATGLPVILWFMATSQERSVFPSRLPRSDRDQVA